MKNPLLTIAITLLTFGICSAQDIMYLMNGDTMTVNVFEVSESDVKYKLLNQDNPSYVLSKAKIYMVEYANGRKEVFATENQSKSDSEKAVSKKEITELETEYRTLKGGGIAGTIIGSLGFAATTISFADGMIKMKSRTDNDLKNKARNQAIASGAVFVVVVATLAAGISSLVNASVLKSRLNQSGTALLVKPTLINASSFNGANVQQTPVTGIGLTLQF